MDGGLRMPDSDMIFRSIATRGRQQSTVSSSTVAVAANAAGAEGADATAIEWQLPPRELVGSWLAALVARDGPETIAQALLASISGDDLCRMMTVLCDKQWGSEPYDENGDLWEGMATPEPVGFRDDQYGTPDRDGSQTRLATPANGNGKPDYRPFIFKKCWHCEPEFQQSSAVCDSKKLLSSLALDMAERAEMVEEAERDAKEAGVEPDPYVRRAARYFMYRKWVAIKFDNVPLGKGNRVRIPPCVVECIRNRFREPGCKCALGGPLANCKEHGYTGHREAPVAE